MTGGRNGASQQPCVSWQRGFEVVDEPEQLSALIGEIYQAALDLAPRIDVLGKIAGFTGGHSCGLVSKHASGKSDKVYCYVGTDPDSLQVYAESHPKLDPLAALPPFD